MWYLMKLMLLKVIFKIPFCHAILVKTVTLTRQWYLTKMICGKTSCLWPHL